MTFQVRDLLIIYNYILLFTILVLSSNINLTEYEDITLCYGEKYENFDVDNIKKYFLKQNKLNNCDNNIIYKSVKERNEKCFCHIF
jgi:hypothetical protein